MSSLDGLAVFIDYQNAYRGAREAFGESDAHHIVGQFEVYLTLRDKLRVFSSRIGGCAVVVGLSC